MTFTATRPITDWQQLSALDARHDAPLLRELFASGAAPDSPDGDCEGRVLGLSGTPFLRFVDVLERLGQRLGGIGWTGKSFDPATGTGYNRLTWTSRIPMFLAMPRYGFERRGGQLIGFRFEHRVEASPLDGTMVRSVAYDNPAYANPLMLPRTRDELVELAPGLLLGRALLHDDAGGWQVVAWFALRHPVGG